MEVIDSKSNASMNFWSFTPDVFNFLKQLFQNFLSHRIRESKSEFFISTVAEEFIKQKKGNLKAITTSAQWFGVTYKEDKPIVEDSINKLISEKVYPPSLWAAVKI